jgi:DNA-binding IclR family transcriptional regulator
MARPAPASARATNIVAFLTSNPGRGFTISELTRQLGMNIASAHATLAVLCDSGFLVRDPAHRTYVLGPALAATGFAAMEQHPAVGAAIAQAEALAEELGVETGVTAIAGRDVVSLARCGPQPETPAIGYPGDRSPLLAPFGAIFRAWEDEATVDGWLERAHAEGPLGALYRRALADIRECGFAVPLSAVGAAPVTAAMRALRDDPLDENAEHRLTEALRRAGELLLPLGELSDADELHYKTVAAPVFDPIGRVLLSLSITGPDHPVPVAEIRPLGTRLARAAAAVTRQSRGRAPQVTANSSAGVAG